MFRTNSTIYIFIPFIIFFARQYSPFPLIRFDLRVRGLRRRSNLYFRSYQNNKNKCKRTKKLTIHTEHTSTHTNEIKRNILSVCDRENRYIIPDLQRLCM